ncbi:hypothetical protein JCM5350_003321 [Sporobolomyces pararoseus]
MTTTTDWITTRMARLGFRRWFVLYGIGLFVIYLNFFRSTSSSSHKPTTVLEGLGLPVEELPKVDRTALEKLRLLELHEGVDRDNFEEMEPGAESRTRKNNALDRPPLVKEIPEIDKMSVTAALGRIEKVPAEILDREICGATSKGHGCQFLIPAWLGEQETKAQQHLHQLGLLAVALNRTLVLPNVSKSRLGTCYRHPFSFYYSPSSLSSLGIPTISQEDFILYTLQRDPPLSAQTVSVVNAKPGVYPQGSIEIDSFSDPFAPAAKPNRNLCLRSPRSKLDFTTNSPLAIYPPEGFHKSEAGRLGFGQSLINTLASQEIGSKSSRKSSSPQDYSLPDVLAFNYEIRFPILTPESVTSYLSSTSTSTSTFSSDESSSSLLPFSHFPYSTLWSSLASHISSTLSPFISIHWRTETLSPSNLSPCADSLLDKIFQVRRQYPEVENVYLATDYPIEGLDSSFATRSEAGGGGVAHSGTFAKSVTDQHHKAFKRFLKNFAYKSRRETGGKLKLTTFSKEQNEISLDPSTSSLPRDLLSQLVNLTTPIDYDPLDPLSPPLPTTLDLGSIDSGLLGILDKLIVTRSQLFLSGVPGQGSSTEGACAKLSSFTLQLIGAREELMEKQEALRDEGDEEEANSRRKQGELWNVVNHWSLNGDEVY